MFNIRLYLWIVTAIFTFLLLFRAIFSDRAFMWVIYSFIMLMFAGLLIALLRLLFKPKQKVGAK